VGTRNHDCEDKGREENQKLQSELRTVCVAYATTLRQTKLMAAFDPFLFQAM